MSNRAVPGVYRHIIDDVVAGVRPDFDEMGIDERVLDALQRSWEAKLAMSGVANFEEDAAMAPFARHARQQAAASAAGPSTSSSASSRGNKHGNRPPPSQSKSSKDSAPNSKKPKKKEQDEDELGSDLDDSDDDADAGQDGTAGIDSGDFIIALYEKVSRVKNKWKIQLKDGVVSADGKDYIFSKCNGDFQW